MPVKKPTVLIIDSDTMTAGAMARAVRRAGYEVVVENGGKKGFKTAVEIEPELIVLEYDMHDMNGLKVLQKLRDEAWGLRAKVIFVSNVYDMAVVNQVLLLGVQDYIMKSDLAVDDFVRLVGKYIKPAQEMLVAV